jgi:hypothetical protein
MDSVEAALYTPQSDPPPIKLEMKLVPRKEIVQNLRVTLHFSPQAKQAEQSICAALPSI